MQHRIALLVSLLAALAACSSGNGRRRSSLAEVDLATTDEAPVLDLGVTEDHAMAADLSTIDAALIDAATVDAALIDLSMIDASSLVDLSTSDLVTIPADLTPSSADLTYLFGVEPYFKASGTGNDEELFPDYPIQVGGTFSPGTIGAVITKAELIDKQQRVYTTFWHNNQSWGFSLSWADVNAVQTITTPGPGLDLYVRMTATDGKTYVQPSPIEITFECVNRVDACHGQCGDCPGPTYTACRTGWKATDTCKTYCEALGQTCSPSCSWTTYSYSMHECSSLNGLSKQVYDVHSSCLTPFGNTLLTGQDITKAGISCCCQ